MKNRLHGFIIGVITMALFMSSIPAFARVAEEIITVNYNNIKIVLNGRVLATENEPFVYEGRTYLPVKDIAEALGLDVDWDGDTQTVYLDATVPQPTPIPGLQIPTPSPQPPTPSPPIPTPTPTPKPYRDVFLFNRQYWEIGNSNGLNITGNQVINRIALYGTAATPLSDGRGLFSNYIVYQLNEEAIKFKAILNPPLDDGSTNFGNSAPELVYRIYGDSRLIYTSPTFSLSTAPQSIELDITGSKFLRIEVDLTVNRRIHIIDGDQGFKNDPVSQAGFRGIENAVITTTDY
jgi:hypothetical protein